MELVPVIGLETHIQLATATKLFCSCALSSDDTPNMHTCPICLGHPGTLPVLNYEAVRMSVLLGLALNGTIARSSFFDRKHYFYPDLPKAYQISQYDHPIMEHGSLTLARDSGDSFTIRIERLHLEEDAGKNIHDPSGATFVDFSRGGTPLCEIVTKPDFTCAQDAKQYLQELRLMVRTLGVSYGDMEKGQLRCDVNVSLREKIPGGALGPLMPKTEVKNINSFRAVERAITFEIARQTELWEAGTPPIVTTTRSWNDETGETDLRREKESSADYRYFPEPDLPPLDLSELTATLRNTLPELPAQKRVRFTTLFALKPQDAEMLVERSEYARFCDATLPYFSLLPEQIAQQARALFAPWVLTRITSVLDDLGCTLETSALTPDRFVLLLAGIAQQHLTPAKAIDVLKHLTSTSASYPDALLACNAQTASSDDLARHVADVLAAFPRECERYRQGETKLLAFFLGQVMKKTGGNAPATETKTLLLDGLRG